MSLLLSRCLGGDGGEDAHHSSSCRLGTDGRKGRIGFGTVHDGTKTMRIRLNLDLGLSQLVCDEVVEVVATEKQGFVDVNRCWRATAGTSNQSPQPQLRGGTSTGHMAPQPHVRALLTICLAKKRRKQAAIFIILECS